MIGTTLIAAGLLVVIFLTYIHISYVKTTKNIPGPKEHFIIGNALELRLTPVELFAMARRFSKEFCGFFKFMAYYVVLYNTSVPEDIEKLISTTRHNEKGYTYKFMAPWLRDGLLLSKGQKWHDRRRILTPSFHFGILSKFCTVIGERSQKLVESLRGKAGIPIDVTLVTTEFTLGATCETAMGTSMNSDDPLWKTYKAAVVKESHLLVERFSKIALHVQMLYWLSPNKWIQNNVLKDLHGFSRRVIKERKEYLKGLEHETDTKMQRNKHTPFLDLLIAAKDEGLIDNEGIQEEVDTFMFEGHDTTSSALTFCLLALANNKEIQEKIFIELDEIFGQSDRAPSMEDLSKMRYMERCIKESLRLYPPVPFISRALSEDTVLSGHKIPAGSTCNIHVYDLHRREDQFPDPERFDPNRFLPENCVNRHPYAYIPFSAGPRNCIGQKFGMLMTKLALSAILRQYKMQPVTSLADIKLQADVVLRNSGPVEIIFNDRK